MKKNMYYAISAPSGTGKSSLIKTFLNTNLGMNFRLSISHTTRNIRSEEIEGKDYFFISKEKFKKMIFEKKFIEYTYSFNNYYGTSFKEVKNKIKSNFSLFFDVNYKGVKKIKEFIPKLISIFILPPSKLDLLKRLYNRYNSNEFELNKRFYKYKKDILNYNKYDFILINRDFNNTLNKIKTIIISKNKKAINQIDKINETIKKLLKK
ncbi:gmk [Wigglesworthia glossinidia endosymbiont of Glossina brevipalpis]|uniref:Guanylate kinase n=1 Tax=Wigglesworthia glossinidia brevipalpis TaxID=36870 RepID=KGUA_WIGBR|nr:RecName: Full=Guanylate kinase; AltName: Full=GMP kinase [Wigglesworthia glossinidia endosymbiont of Glossina brevipalpis]BAC24552.1 gmk [Wigglesworthia glossinidia endosymbiont of Glossina brevipalpis]